MDIKESYIISEIDFLIARFFSILVRGMFGEIPSKNPGELKVKMEKNNPEEKTFFIYPIEWSECEIFLRLMELEGKG